MLKPEFTPEEARAVVDAMTPEQLAAFRDYACRVFALIEKVAPIVDKYVEAGIGHAERHANRSSDAEG